MSTEKQTLKNLFDVLHINMTLSTPHEIKEACELIIDVQSMTNGEIDCIRAAFENGPICIGDMPCKSSTSLLIENRYLSDVLVKSREWFVACTPKGGRAYRIISYIYPQTIGRQP